MYLVMEIHLNKAVVEITLYLFTLKNCSLGESIIFSGNVNKHNEDRNLQISIFDSNQNLIVTKKISVNADTTFSHNFLLNENFLDETI